MPNAYGGAAYPQEDDENALNPTAPSSSGNTTGGGTNANSGVGAQTGTPAPYAPNTPQVTTPQTYGSGAQPTSSTSSSSPSPYSTSATDMGGSMTANTGAAPTSYNPSSTSSTSAPAPYSSPTNYTPSTTAPPPPTGANPGYQPPPNVSMTSAPNANANANTNTNTIGTFAGKPINVPASYAGESTSTPGYAQDAAGDAAVNQMSSNVNASDDAMAAVTKAAGTAAQVFGNADGSAGIVTTVNGTPTRLTYNPATGGFSDGSTTYTAQQVQQFTQQAGLGGVQQHIDGPQGTATSAPAPYTPPSALNPNNVVSTDQGGMLAKNLPNSGQVAMPLAANPNLPNGGAPSTANPISVSNLPPFTGNPQLTASGGASAPAPTSSSQQGTAQVGGQNLLQDYQSMLGNLDKGSLAGAPGVDTNSVLQGLLTGKSALQGPTANTQGAIDKLLANPSAYNSDAVQQTYNNLGGQIDDEYALEQQGLTNNMAARGLSDSSIAGGKLSDLNIGKRSAKEQLAASLATQQAQDLSGATSNAINLGLSGSGQQQTASAQNYAQQLQGLGFNQNNANTTTQQQQQILQSILGYGQQGFNNDLMTNQQNQNSQTEQDQLYLQLLGLQ